MGKEENAGIHIFSLPSMFPKAISARVVSNRDCGKVLRENVSAVENQDQTACSV